MSLTKDKALDILWILAKEGDVDVLESQIKYIETETDITISPDELLKMKQTAYPNAFLEELNLVDSAIETHALNTSSLLSSLGNAIKYKILGNIYNAEPEQLNNEIYGLISSNKDSKVKMKSYVHIEDQFFSVEEIDRIKEGIYSALKLADQNSTLHLQDAVIERIVNDKYNELWKKAVGECSTYFT